MLSLEAARDLFELPGPINGKAAYEFRALTHGLPPKAVKENLRLFYEEWAAQGVDAWNNAKKSRHIFFVGDEPESEKSREFGWWDLPEVMGDLIISRLLNAPRGSCVMLPNAAAIVLAVLSCAELNRPGRRKVICSDGEFPSVLHSIRHFNNTFRNYSPNVRGEVQLDLQVVPAVGGRFPLDEILRTIDKETAIVFASHVGFVSGERLTNSDLGRLASACRASGALLAVDGYHALGSHPVDVGASGADLYFGGLLKEGCGSSGCGYLYIRPGLELTPGYSGWFGDNEPFAFHLEPSPHERVRRRFLLGTTAVASLYHGVEGSKIMLRLGLKKTAEDVLSKVELAVGKFASAGISVVSPRERERMSSMIVLNIPGANRFREFVIKEHNIFCDARRDTFVRLAPHIYNSAEEVGTAADIMCRTYKSGEYLDYQIGMSGGPVT